MQSNPPIPEKLRQAAGRVVETDIMPAANTAIIPCVTTDSLLLVGPGYQLIIPPAAEARKAALLASAAAIIEVTTPEHVVLAQAEIKDLASIRTSIEKARKLVKAPVIALGDEIDDKAKDFAAALKAQEDRISGLVRDHALKVEAARQRAELERQRVERERREAEARAERERAAEVARQAAEAARAERERAAAIARQEELDRQEAAAREAAERAAAELAEANSPKAKKAAAEAAKLAEAERIRAAEAAEAERLAEEAAEDARQAEEEFARQDEAARQAEAARLEDENSAMASSLWYLRCAAAGVRGEGYHRALPDENRRLAIESRQGVKGVKFPLAFEVQDITELYRHHPELVTLAPKTREIITYIKAEELALDGQIPTVPGLKIFRDAKVATR